MATPKSAPGGGRFSAFGSTTVGNGALTYNDLCILSRDYSTTIGNDSWDNGHTSDLCSRGKRLDEEPLTLVQRAQRTGGSSNG